MALRAGGNAVDAVCAAAVASFVCELPLTSPAGAGLVIHGSRDRDFQVLDFFARTPGRGGRPDTLDFFAVEVDFGATTQEFHVGRGAAAVPGALPGILQLHGAHGRLPLADVIEPGLVLARDGYVLSRGGEYVFGLLAPIYGVTEPTRALTGPDAKAGARLKVPGLATLLEDLARSPEATLAAFQDELVREFGPDRGGLLSAEDFEAWQPVERSPLAVPFQGMTVLTAPPPSAGGGLIAVALRLAEHIGLSEEVYGAHWLRLAEVLGGVSQARSDGYDANLSRADFLPALLDARNIDGTLARFRERAAERGLGGTTHISVLDDEGGAAAMTASNGEGCGFLLPTWGIHVNNFLGEEDINPHGFHTQPAGFEMPTMMAPTIVLRDGRPLLVLGSGGSNRLRSAIVQVVVNHLGFGQPLEDAVATSRLHVEGDRLWFESTGLTEATRAQLLASWPGASEFVQPSMFFGGVHAVAQEGGAFIGAGDPRRDGAVCSPEDV